MYRNVAYMSKDQTVRLYTWDKDGKRVWFDLPYKPYLYVEAGMKQRGDKVSLFNTNLRKKEFANEYRRREYITDQSNQRGTDGPLRIFESMSAPQQFLVDQYWQQSTSPEFSQFPIKVAFVDIETYSHDQMDVPHSLEEGGIV